MPFNLTHRTEPDRVRRYTSHAQLRRIDDATENRLRLYSSQPPDVIQQRITELRREWSIERYLQINVATVGLATVALAATLNRKWGFLTCAGLGFFLVHAVEGFDPPIPLLRRLGIRTRAEIDREIYALKVMRGDFDTVDEEAPTGGPNVRAALQAVEL